MSFLKMGWVMARAPLAPGAWAITARDDQAQHRGRQEAVGDRRVFGLRGSLTVRARRLDACLPVGDPIDGFAHWLAPLRFGVCSLCPLLPECERGPLALVRGRSWPASRHVCASLWLPIH